MVLIIQQHSPAITVNSADTCLNFGCLTMADVWFLSYCSTISFIQKSNDCYAKHQSNIDSFLNYS